MSLPCHSSLEELKRAIQYDYAPRAQQLLASDPELKARILEPLGALALASIEPVPSEGSAGVVVAARAPAIEEAVQLRHARRHERRVINGPIRREKTEYVKDCLREHSCQ